MTETSHTYHHSNSTSTSHDHSTSPVLSLFKLTAENNSESLTTSTTEDSIESPSKKSDDGKTDVDEDDQAYLEELILENHDESSSESPHAHPALEALQVIDVDQNIEIHPNGDLFHIENEWLEMDMLILLRTPNVDDETCNPGTDRNQALSQHFKGKQRRFEFQYQGKLKKKPDGKLFCFCMELGDSPKLSLLQKALVTTCMMFMKKMSPSFHFNMGGSDTGKNKKSGKGVSFGVQEGKYETPHMAFGVEKVLDRLAITKPGEKPPVLGKSIPEEPDCVKQRREGKFKVDWNCEDVYTMAIWSHYIDWIDWEVVHIPGVKHFSMDSILGDMSVYMQLYLLDKNRKDKNKHYQKDIQHVVNLEFKKNPDFVKATQEEKRILLLGERNQRNSRKDASDERLQK